MKNSRTRHLKLIAMTVWICILSSFAYWFELDTRQEERQRALTTANAFFQQLVISRQWNASHGGVYVPLTTQTPPNQYLPIKNRELTADNGLRLTRINPAYMTRQMAELAKGNASGIQFHVTSLRPIRPENKATEWEERWLKSFEQGVKEQGEFFTAGRSTWFRYMAPLRLEPACLRCHVEQGYQEGAIRGGISVSFPYPVHSHFHLVAGYGSVALVGLIFIFIVGSLYDRKHRLLDAIFDSPTPVSVVDKNHTILMANKSYWAMFGALPDHRKTIKCHEHRPGKACHTEDCPLFRILGGAGIYTCEATKEKDGVMRHFIITAKPLTDAKGRVTRMVESFQEITKRKRTEEKLEVSNRKLEALSNTDGLTGVANRRRFDEVLAHEYGRHARSGAKLSLIMLDIDHFKPFNDGYGHIKGDECLRQVAGVIAACAVRPADLVARYGGEEFACILPETESGGAVVVAEKIRREILARAIPHNWSDTAACVTVSQGVVTMSCTANGSAANIVAQADELLYRAKSSGRNRVEFAAPDDV